MQQDSFGEMERTQPVETQTPTPIAALPQIKVHPFRHRVFVFAKVFAGCAVMSGAAVATFLLLQTSPTDRFYQAIEQNMQTSYIRKHYIINDFKMFEDVHLGSYDIDSYSDFSNPKSPRSRITEETTFSGKFDKINYIATKDYSNYIQYIHTPNADLGQAPNLKLNQWHSVDMQYLGTTDFFNFGGKLNTTLGELLVGNYSANDRIALLNMYKNLKAFKFDPQKDVGRQQVNGEDAYVYTVMMNGDAITKINREAVKRLGLATSVPDIYSGSIKLAVSGKTGRFIQLNEDPTSDSGAIINYEYPTSLDIQIPTSTLAFSPNLLLKNNTSKN